MKYKDVDLTGSDYNTLFTRDPGYFIEHIIVNIMFAGKSIDSSKEPMLKDGDAAYIDKQKQIFLKWIGFYTNTVKEEVLSEITKRHADKVTELLEEAERRGRLLALTSLPFKANLIGPDKVDMAKVNEIIKQLKAKEPIGVTNHDTEQATSTN